MVNRNKKTAKKRRGRPATGRDPLVAARLPKEIIKQIDQEAKSKGVTRSAALRAIVERGLNLNK